MLLYFIAVSKQHQFNSIQCQFIISYFISIMLWSDIGRYGLTCKALLRHLLYNFMCQQDESENRIIED